MRAQDFYGDSPSPDDRQGRPADPADRAGSDREHGGHHRGGSHQDGHPHLHHHGFSGDHRGGHADPSGAPGSDDGFGLQHGQHGQAAEAPVAPHGADDLGWTSAAWADAGGFEAVLIGHLPADFAHAGAAAPFVIAPIEHLDITFNNFVQNNQVVLDAANGGSVTVGGDINNVALQHAFDQPAGLPDAHHLA